MVRFITQVARVGGMQRGAGGLSRLISELAGGGSISQESMYVAQIGVGVAAAVAVASIYFAYMRRT